MKRNVRQNIIDTFIAMVESSSASKVHVADLINELDINRNTFYYYFSNKQDVSEYIFRTDLHESLIERFKADQLVFSPCSGKGSSNIQRAYYVHIETGARTLDMSEFCRTLVDTLNQRRTFYRKLLSPLEIDFYHLLEALYTPALEKDIEFMLNGRYMHPVSQRMLAQSCCNALLASARFSIETSQIDVLSDPRVFPYWNIIQEALYNAIEKHPTNRFQ